MLASQRCGRFVARSFFSSSSLSNVTGSSLGSKSSVSMIPSLVSLARSSMRNNTASLSVVVVDRSSSSMGVRLFSTEEKAVKVPLDLIKQLRQRSSASVMECREALLSNNMDVEEAYKWIVKKGLSGAGVKNKAAAEGAVYSSANANVGFVVEVNSETDFVSRGESFQAFASELPKVLAKSANHSKAASSSADFVLEEISSETILDNPCSMPHIMEPKENSKVSDVLSWLRFQIKENINVRRGVKLSVPGVGGIVSEYTHGKGKYVALVGLKVHTQTPLDAKAAETVREFGHRVAIQVVGFSPEFLNRKEVTQSALEQKGIAASDKGKIEKLISESVLLEQPFHIIASPSDEIISVTHKEGATVQEALVDLASALQVPKVEIVKFVRWKVGEGIEKKTQDFASEVAAAAKS
eukprot:TRINITY_DN2337_c0_g1_i1.p1 TRINITY_DN2337_c0_g1~~TRINITY_DN2337_c0_g1_i1.p1  ORF type:complete len:431 (+),score=115.60 TRINITY_DN2337_c0_g1_i1:61-1293(+)